MNERLDRLEDGIVTAYANGDLASAQSVAREAARLEWQLQGPERRRAAAIASQAQEAVALIQTGPELRPDFDEWANTVVAAVKRHRSRSGESVSKAPAQSRTALRRWASRMLLKIAD